MRAVLNASFGVSGSEPIAPHSEIVEDTRATGETVSWYALRTKSRMERNVLDALRWHRMEVYLPVESRIGAKVGAEKSAARPLFPGYLFCRTSLDVPLRIVTIPGVVGFVGCRGIPLPVRDEEVLALRQLEESRRALRSSKIYKVGQKVRVRDGALQGLQGWVRRVKGGSNLIIAVDFLRSAVSVSLESDCLEPV